MKKGRGIVFVEDAITGAVRGLLENRVDELLGELDFAVPVIDFDGKGGAATGTGYAVRPSLLVESCERSTKERVVELAAYRARLDFAFVERDGERTARAFAWAVTRAVAENRRLGGVVCNAYVTRVTYTAPACPGCGEDFCLTVDLRVLVEEIG